MSSIDFNSQTLKKTYKFPTHRIPSKPYFIYHISIVVIQAAEIAPSQPADSTKQITSKQARVCKIPTTKMPHPLYPLDES